MITKENSILLLATRFADRGDWTVDQQFIPQTGSSYLLAHGIGTPLGKDAFTTFDIPEEGDYTLWVRTKNWTRPWSDGPTPGIFRVLLDGEADGTVFGTGETDTWYWQRGSVRHFGKGVHTAALRDLTGFDGRCDALLLTRDAAAPGDSLEEYRVLRRSLLGEETPADKGHFDFVVVGGGIAGICAALSAARLGARVALVHDRYILGGNNSSEVRLGLGGMINLPPYGSLGYMLNEIGPERGGNARGAHYYEDERKMRVVLAEKNITLFTGYSVIGAERNGDRVVSVTAMEVAGQTLIRISGDVFSDCTGDGNLAALAGAESLSGREARSEFGESLAPETRDSLHMGGTIGWYCEVRNTPCSFPDSFDWGLPLGELTVEPVHRSTGAWEVGMHYDPVTDAEKTRDYGMYVAYSTFSYCKNRYSAKEDWECTHLVWVSHVLGRRETRRVRGEYVLRQQDILKKIPHEDGTASLSWNIDLHFPRTDNSRNFPGDEWLSESRTTPVDPYPIPLRCFCAKDIENLMMAGRTISVTHVAFGSTHAPRTSGMVGEVVGMAAWLCIRDGILPRDIPASRMEELRALMRKGTGRTDVQYNQFYTLVDNTAKQIESI